MNRAGRLHLGRLFLFETDLPFPHPGINCEGTGRPDHLKEEGGGGSILYLGIAFILTGMGCMAYPESFALSVASLACMLAGLLLAVCGAVRRGKS